MAAGYECMIHMHAIADACEIVKIEAKLVPETKKMVAASFLKVGEQGKAFIKVTIVITQVRRPICMEKFDYMPSLGRFTLRDEGKYYRILF